MRNMRGMTESLVDDAPRHKNLIGSLINRCQFLLPDWSKYKKEQVAKTQTSRRLNTFNYTIGLPELYLSNSFAKVHYKNMSSPWN